MLSAWGDADSPLTALPISRLLEAPRLESLRINLEYCVPGNDTEGDEPQPWLVRAASGNGSRGVAITVRIVLFSHEWRKAGPENWPESTGIDWQESREVYDMPIVVKLFTHQCKEKQFRQPDPFSGQSDGTHWFLDNALKRGEPCLQLSCKNTGAFSRYLWSM